MIPSMTRSAAATRSRRCPQESEPLAWLKFESKQRVIFPLATVAMAYWYYEDEVQMVKMSLQDLRDM